MKKKPFYTRWWVWVLAIILVAFFIIGIPLLINECYIKDSGYLTVWGGSEVFAYYASVLSFIGTVILGVITVWQNRKAIDTNNKLLELETKSTRGYFIPKHKIHDIVMDIPCTYRHNLKKRGITVVGTGNDIINVNKTVVIVNNQRVLEQEFRVFVTTMDEFREVHIPVNLTDDEEKFEELEITIKIHMENSKKYRYVQSLILTLKKESNNAYLLTAFNSDIADDNL